jgi:hypothetical protein
MEDATDERRRGERRGRGLSSNKKLNDFLYAFWGRYFRDRPDLDRRKLPDRRQASQDEPQESGKSLLTRLSFAWGRIFARFKSNKE